MRIPVSEYRPRVGDEVRTNGDIDRAMPIAMIQGVIEAPLERDRFIVRMADGKGWKIARDNPEAWIEVVSSSNRELLINRIETKQMETKAVDSKKKIEITIIRKEGKTLF